MDPNPKYRISCKRSGESLPYRFRFTERKRDLATICDSLHKEHPEDRIEVRMTKGLRHQYPLRWEFREGELVPTGWYDQLADGRRPLSAKQLSSLMENPDV